MTIVSFKKSWKSALVLGSFLMALHLHTADPAMARGGGGHQGPPPESYTACEGKSQGDTASFESPRGDTVTGTCVQDKTGDRLVLHPDNPPEHRNTDERKN